MKYAKRTGVDPTRSKAQIERTLTRYGADQFFYAQEAGRVVVGFRMHGKVVRIEMRIPMAEEFSVSGKGRKRSKPAMDVAWAQAVRQHWRALELVIKAKLEAVESGITTFEQEFMAHLVLPDGQTVGQWAVPQIEKAYKDKKMPPLLPMAAGSQM